MAANSFARTVDKLTKQAHANATRCIMVWTALALREEGFGRVRIKRVLENIHKYACTLNGKTTIDDQLRHIESITGLKIVWRNDDTITIDELEEWEDEDEGNSEE